MKKKTIDSGQANRELSQPLTAAIHVLNIVIINLTGYMIREFCRSNMREERHIDYAEELILTFQGCGSALEIMALARRDISFNIVIITVVKFLLLLHWNSMDTTGRGDSIYYIEKGVVCRESFPSVLFIIMSQLMAGHLAWLFDSTLKSLEGIKDEDDACTPELPYSPKTTLIQASLQFVDSLNKHLADKYSLFSNILWITILNTFLSMSGMILTGGFTNPNMATVVHYECFGLNDMGINHFVAFIIHYWFGSLCGVVLAHFFYHAYIGSGPPEKYCD